jgi:hypothetical protein
LEFFEDYRNSQKNEETNLWRGSGEEENVNPGK